MKKLLNAVAWVAMVGLVCAVAPGRSHAQVTNLPTIKIKQPKPKIDKFRGEVVNCTPVAITVRDAKSATTIRTFNFVPALTRYMENRYMESGSKVTVRYIRQSDNAVGLQGKILRR